MAENRCPKCGASFMGAAVCPRCKAANPKRLKVKRGQEVEVFVPAKIEWVKGRVTDPKQGPMGLIEVEFADPNSGSQSRAPFGADGHALTGEGRIRAGKKKSGCLSLLLLGGAGIAGLIELLLRLEA